MPLEEILGGGAGWNPPFPDQAQALAAHLAFQSDSWRWPLLNIGTMFWPHGVSGALADFNPLLSLLSKLWAKVSGGAPENWFGAWMALCWLLQPVAAVYAARGLRAGVVGSIAAGVLAACWPALLVRMGHLNLCGHFLMLFSLGLVFRRLRRPGGWIAPAAVMLVAALVHPYLFQLCAALFAAIPLHAALVRRAGWRREMVCYVLSGIVAAGTFMALSGVTGGKDSGFVFFSMNLLSPIWPQHSGIFGADLPFIDATGGQYEGYNWLGAGVLLLTLVGIARFLATRPSLRLDLRSPFAALVIVLIGLTMISLSSRVYAGHVKLLDLGAQPWEGIFGTFRASGRAFWPVGYAVMLFAVAAVARLPKPIGIGLLVVAMALQIIDTQPLRAGAHAAWANGSRIATAPVPDATTLFTVLPFPGCSSDPSIGSKGTIMLLAAVRMRARTGEVGLGRPPAWFNCGRFLADGLELPLRRGESRAFLGAETQNLLRPELLGPEAQCRQDGVAILCGRDVSLPAGEPVSKIGKFARLQPPDALAGAALAPALGSFWRIVEPSGEVWSEGPRSTLAFEVPAGIAFTLSIEVEGVARPNGGKRVLHALVGGAEVASRTLIDGQPTTMALPVSAAAAADGLLRVGFDIDGDIDPKKYGFTAPVARAGIKLLRISLSAERG